MILVPSSSNEPSKKNNKTTTKQNWRVRPRNFELLKTKKKFSMLLLVTSVR